MLLRSGILNFQGKWLYLRYDYSLDSDISYIADGD